LDPVVLMNCVPYRADGRAIARFNDSEIPVRRSYLQVERL